MAVVKRYSNGVLDPSVVPPRQVPEGVNNARVKVFATRIDVVADDSIGSTYLVARVPSSARLLSSALYHSAIAGVSFTFGDVNDEDGLLAAASFNAAGTKAIGAVVASCGKMLWEILGYDEDPGKPLELYLKNTVAIPAGGGTIAAELYFATA